MRVWNWVEKLHQAIDEAQKTSFDYGVANCGLFAAGCIDAILEDSHRADELRTMFSDTRTALEFVRDAGGIEAAVTQRLGTPVSWALLRRGDVALVETQDGPGLGVVTGATIAMCDPKNGLVFVPLDLATAGWNVD